MTPDGSGGLIAYDPDEDLEEDDDDDEDEDEDDGDDEGDEDEDDEEDDESETWQVRRAGPRTLKPAARLTSGGDRA
jgi:hypothetical protein